MRPGVSGCSNGAFLNLGYHFGGPHNKDYIILRSILGSLILGNYLMELHEAGF